MDINANGKIMYLYVDINSPQYNCRYRYSKTYCFIGSIKMIKTIMSVFSKVKIQLLILHKASLVKKVQCVSFQIIRIKDK